MRYSLFTYCCYIVFLYIYLKLYLLFIVCVLWCLKIIIKLKFGVIYDKILEYYSRQISYMIFNLQPCGWINLRKRVKPNSTGNTNKINVYANEPLQESTKTKNRLRMLWVGYYWVLSWCGSTLLYCFKSNKWFWAKLFSR